MRHEVLLLLGTLAAPAMQAQAPPVGGGFTWELVGDQPLDADALAFDVDGRLWAGAFGIWRLDGDGPNGTWELMLANDIADDLLHLGRDTVLITRGGRVRRTTDGGKTWPHVHDEGFDGLTEISTGLLVVGAIPDAAHSLDRGATWEPAVFEPEPAHWVEAMAKLGSGRVGAGGSDGVTASEDSARTFRPTTLWQDLRYVIQAFVRVERPGGGERVLAFGYDQTLPHERVWSSDDEGATWQERGPLPEEVSRGSGADPISLGGPSAIVVLSGGTVYRTDDAGEMWTAIGQAPASTENGRAMGAALDAGGRLYVSLHVAGPDDAWVYRTVEPLPTAAESPPPPVPAVALSVQPNPARGTAEVVLTLGAPSEVTLALYDMLGRRVAVLAQGRFDAGRQTVPLNVAALPAGVYVVRLTAGEAVRVRRITLVR